MILILLTAVYIYLVYNDAKEQAKMFSNNIRISHRDKAIEIFTITVVISIGVTVVDIKLFVLFLFFLLSIRWLLFDLFLNIRRNKSLFYNGIDEKGEERSVIDKVILSRLTDKQEIMLKSSLVLLFFTLTLIRILKLI